MVIEGRNGFRVLVINAQGRVFMNPVDDPFRAVEAASELTIDCTRRIRIVSQAPRPT